MENRWCLPPLALSRIASSIVSTFTLLDQIISWQRFNRGWNYPKTCRLNDFGTCNFQKTTPEPLKIGPFSIDENMRTYSWSLVLTNQRRPYVAFWRTPMRWGKPWLQPRRAFDYLFLNPCKHLWLIKWPGIFIIDHRLTVELPWSGWNMGSKNGDTSNPWVFLPKWACLW